MLTVGSLLFWAILAVWVVSVWILTEREYGLFGFLSTVAYVAILQFVFKVNVLLWVAKNPGLLLVFAGMYLFFGGLWAFWRWYLFVKDKLEEYQHLKSEWLTTKNVTETTVPDTLKEEWGKYINSTAYRQEMCQIPKVRQHKAKIMRWIGYFPISAISWVFNDMVRRFVKIVYEYMHDWLQGIANNVFASIKKDLPNDFKIGKGE